MLSEAYDYKSWADRRTLDAVSRVDAVAHEHGHAFMLQQLNHMIIVEELFRSRLLGNEPPHNATNTPSVPVFEELSERIEVSNGWYGEFVDSLNTPEARVCFLFADGRPGSMSIREILFHVVNHGSYHRGSIAHALDSAGKPHPADGYGIYIHEKEPQRRQA